MSEKVNIYDANLLWWLMSDRRLSKALANTLASAEPCWFRPALRLMCGIAEFVWRGATMLWFAAMPIGWRPR